MTIVRRPAYITRERMEMAPNLKMCVTCGIGSDHVDLQAALERNIAVTEVRQLDNPATPLFDNRSFAVHLLLVLLRSHTAIASVSQSTW